MSCGVPVVCTNIGGLPELVTHGFNGFLCDVGAIEAMASHVLHILESQERWKCFSENARNTALRFDTEKIVPIYEHLYTQVLNR
jgi:glycosyltransferase involved in cell wall biosynthesis